VTAGRQASRAPFRTAVSHGAGRPRVGFRLLAIDQGLSSASNFAIAAAAGLALDADGFGRFALLLLAISIAVNLARAVWHEPDLVSVGRGRGSGRTGPADRSDAGLPGPTSTTLGGLSILAVAGLTVAGSTLVVAGAALVAVLANDRARYRAVARGRSGPLLAADGAWLAVVLAGLAGAIQLNTVPDLLQLWLVGAALGTTILVGSSMMYGDDEPAGHQRRSEETAALTDSWMPQRLAILADFLLFAGMTQVGGLVLAAFLPFDEIASLRGAIVIFGPVGVLTGALATWIFADVARGPATVGHEPIGAVWRAASMVGGIGLLATVAAAAVPDTVGVRILGSGWPPSVVLVLIGATVACQALSTPAMMLLRIGDDQRLLLTLRAAAFSAFVASTIGLATVAGTAGAVAIGYLVTNALFAVAVWWSVRRSNAVASGPDQSQR
jgi:hypothetical protein